MTFAVTEFHAAGTAALPGQHFSSMPEIVKRPTRAEINLDNLIHNFRVTRTALGSGVAIMPTVKADAYGHGAARCAKALEAVGARLSK